MFSQTVEYALRAMMHLACIPMDATLNSETLAERTQVPKGYLSKIMRDLVVAGLVTARRGPSGGFALARDADAVSILDVVNAVDRIERIRTCPLGNPAHIKLCPLHQRLDDALANIEREFSRTTLGELLESPSPSGGRCRSLVRLNVPKTR
jgi:Rrf2 family protein